MIKIIAILFVIVLMIFLLWIPYQVHKDDAKLRAACEAAGGVFVEAREPIHICVKRQPS